MAASADKTRKIVTNAVAAAGALTGLVVALTKLRDETAGLLRVSEQWIGACGIVLALGFVWAFWIGPPVARWWRARNAVPKLKPGGFRLHPYDSTDRAAFAREDKEHERILAWLRGAADPLLYLAGASGSGKSSLLHAYVLPELFDLDKHICIAVRGVNEPLRQIRTELLRPNAVWQNRKEDAEETTAALAQRAAAHLSRSDQRLYIVFDQSEELLILHERSSPEVAGVLEFIKAVTGGEAGTVPTVLLVMRSDFEGRVRELGLPSERMGVNKEVVRLVSEPQAEAFLERAGLSNTALRQRLVREASDLEETKGRLRFITLNFLGLAACEVPGRVRGGRTGRGLLRGAVRAWVTDRAVREQADAVLRPMISDEETKKPLALAEIVQVSGLPAREVLRVLMQFERDGLVRRFQNEKEIWEISHDFVARLLQRVLDDLRGSLLVRARPWLGAAAGAAALSVLVGAGMWLYVRNLQMQHLWELAGANVQEEKASPGVKCLSFGRPGAVTDALLDYLTYAPTLGEVTHIDLSGAKITDTGVAALTRPGSVFKAVTALKLSGTEVADAGVAALARPDSGLTALTTLDLTGTPVADAGVSALARTDSGLKSLNKLILSRTDVTDAGMAQLASTESGLKKLTELYVGGTHVTDIGVKELARADTGLKSLTTLDLSVEHVTNVGVKELARAGSGVTLLTSLELSFTKVTDDGLKELARADGNFTQLTTLDLSSTEVTDEWVMELARADRCLMTLTKLDLRRTAVSDDATAALQKARPILRILR